MNIVIGSGPAGISAAHALLKRGLPVTLIDAGIELESNIRRSVETLASQTDAEWDPSFIESMKAKTKPDSSGIPLKHTYGSDFHLQDIYKYILSALDGPRNYCSLARGGLSNVWGGAILPYSSDDLAGWPLSTHDLEPYYRAILSELPVAAAKDDLEKFFPLYTDNIQDFPMSSQAQSFMEDLIRSKTKLNKNNLFFGKSRLTVQVAPSATHSGCILCGLCLYGCPYSLIYNTSQTLDVLMQNPNFRYVSGIVVEKLVEEPSGVRVHGLSMKDQSLFEFTGAKVYVGAGVLNTTKIALATMNEYERSFSIKTSQHFVLPLLRFKPVINGISERLHTLSQIFIELFDPKKPNGNCHIQIYTFNELYEKVLRKKFGPLFNLFEKFFMNSILSRLLITQSYVSSDYSPTLSARLDKTSNKLRMTPVPAKTFRRKFAKIIWSLTKLSTALRAVPLLPFLKISHSGVGAHIGGVFPMRKNPGEYETDILGRLPRFKLIHFIDASIFTSIPPSTVTLTVMANAYRIATES